eukprot:COSAG04_NODE_3644_length_2642_cov_2.753441_1_plen_87_part_00
MSVQEVLSDVVALDYPFTPWNMLVLSDSKDAYTDAEWVPQVRTAKLPDLRTVVVRRLIVWLCVQFVSGLLARLEPDRAKELVKPFM